MRFATGQPIEGLTIGVYVDDGDPDDIMVLVVTDDRVVILGQDQNFCQIAIDRLANSYLGWTHDARHYPLDHPEAKVWLDILEQIEHPQAPAAA